MKVNEYKDHDSETDRFHLQSNEAEKPTQIYRNFRMFYGSEPGNHRFCFA